MSDLDLEALMRKRSAQYMRLAKTITPMMQTASTPEFALYSLLMDAYRDGGRDMHAAVLEVFEATAGVYPS